MQALQTIILKGRDLARFFHEIGMDVPEDFHSLRINVAGESVKVKRNEWIWSAPLGELDTPR